MIVAVDWSHTRGLVTYDGKKTSVVDRRALLKRLAGKSNGRLNPASPGAGGESILRVKSRLLFNSSAPLVILEQGCPLSLIFDILRTGCEVKTISNRATQDYRVEHSIEKSDEIDARIIYELASNGAKLTQVNLDDKDIQLLELYQRYKRYQKARVAMVNMKKAYVRQFGEDGKSKIQPPFSDGSLPYDIGIDTLKAAENSCLKKIVKLAPPVPQSLKIKGLGPRLWAGIYIAANPANFPTLSSYLRYCGLVNLDQLDHKWNRHARMLYHLLAEETMRLRDKKFRLIYDKCKEDIATSHQDYTPKHIHNAALNRTATFLAKGLYATKGDSYVIYGEVGKTLRLNQGCPGAQERD